MLRSTLKNPHQDDSICTTQSMASYMLDDKLLAGSVPVHDGHFLFPTNLLC